MNGKILLILGRNGRTSEYLMYADVQLGSLMGARGHNRKRRSLA